MAESPITLTCIIEIRYEETYKRKLQNRSKAVLPPLTQLAQIFWIFSSQALAILHSGAPTPAIAAPTSRGSMNLPPPPAAEGCLRCSGLGIFQISSNCLHCIFDFHFSSSEENMFLHMVSGTTFLWLTKSGFNILDKLWTQRPFFFFFCYSLKLSF